ncbi:MAG: hypothetical protein ABW184_15560 [Sphingobium sp.]
MCGCSERKVPDQLVASGDKFEVTLQEYDQLLRQAPPVTKEAVGPVRRMMLDRLIGDKLLADGAVNAGIDKDPNISQAIAAARRTILAQAYIDRLTSGLPKADGRDVEKYYKDHPDLFSNRRRLIVEEYVLRSDMPNVRAYVDALQQDTFDALTSALRESIPGLRPAMVVRFSDELPDSRDGTIGKLAPGSNIVYQSPGQIHLGRVQSIGIEPIALAAASSRIEQAINEDKKSNIVANAIKDLRKARNIEIINTNLKSISNERPKEVAAR